MKLIGVLWLFSLCALNIQAFTHWMVTESGLIQPRANSPFEMERPYDLLAFLNQDKRWDNIISLYDDLSKRQSVVAKLWENLQKNSDITTLIMKDENCPLAGALNYIDWFATVPEEGLRFHKIPDEEFALYVPAIGQDTDIPDCKKISSLTFSMFAFEHLEGMRQRENLTSNAELGLPVIVSPIMNLDQFGHWLSVCLRKNSTSWLHYNMASMYWRARGNAPKAVECSRRAVHYAPREYKDIALLNLGSVLHRSKKPADAVTVLGAAVDHNPRFHINHFALANAYAIVGDYNNSLRHLDVSLGIEPTSTLCKKHRYGVLCHNALLKRMDVLRGILDELREELIEFNNRESHWLKSQSAFLRTMKHEKDFDFRSAEKTCEKMAELTGLKIKELKREGDRNSVIQYFLDGPVSISEKLQERGVLALDSAYSLQRLVKHIEKHADLASNYVQPDLNKLIDGEILKEIGPLPVFPDIFPSVSEINTESQTVENKKRNQVDDEFAEYFGGHILYPPTMKINRNLEDFDRQHDWPSSRFCKESAPSFPENVDVIFPVFLPFENKGIKLKWLLSRKIGVPVNEEHELPWHPPTCPQDKDAAAFTQKKSKQQVTNDVVNTGYLRQKLLEYAGDGDIEAVLNMQDVEIGHRIYTAMQLELAPNWILYTLSSLYWRVQGNNVNALHCLTNKKLAPNWILYTLSSLYWRVRGNNVNALHCLLSASRCVSAKYKDVVLTSLASLYLEMGFFDESLTAAEEAFKTSVYEPATNFVLAELNMVKKHRSTHMFHLKQVVRVEPRFMGGLPRDLLNAWACIFKQITAYTETEFADGDICTQVEPGVNMVCERDGTNCHVTNIRCFSRREQESTSTLMRMMNQKDEKTKDSDPNVVDDSMFDAFVANMPTSRGDVMAHQQNYEMMLRSIDTALRGCGPKGCTAIQAKDLELSPEDCTNEHYNLQYWQNTITLKGALDKIKLRVIEDVAAVTPSFKKVPECKWPMSPEEDFYLYRLSKVDVDDWKPLAKIINDLVGLFSNFEYALLGGKIAKYVEDNPDDWAGLLVAGWWCGAGGRGSCCARCLAAAGALAPPTHAALPLRALAVLLHLQGKHQEAKDTVYLSFYMEPKNNIDTLLLGIAHTFTSEYEQAVWMYRYALMKEPLSLPAKACLHATMCLMIYGETHSLKMSSVS